MDRFANKLHTWIHNKMLIKIIGVKISDNVEIRSTEGQYRAKSKCCVFSIVC